MAPQQKNNLMHWTQTVMLGIIIAGGGWWCTTVYNKLDIATEALTRHEEQIEQLRSGDKDMAENAKTLEEIVQDINQKCVKYDLLLLTRPNNSQ